MIRLTYPEALSWLVVGGRVDISISKNLGWREAADFVAHHNLAGMRALRAWALKDARRYPAGDIRRAGRVLLAQLLSFPLRELMMPDKEVPRLLTWAQEGVERMARAKLRGAA